MKKSIIYFVVAFLCCCGLFTSSVDAKINVEDRIVNYDGKAIKFSELKKNLCLSEVGKVVFEEPITVDGVNLELYCTFESREEAVSDLMEKYTNAFSYLKKNYDLPEKITVDNWKEFKSIISLAYGNDQKMVK